MTGLAAAVVLAVLAIRSDVAIAVGLAGALADATVGFLFVAAGVLTGRAPWRERALVGAVGLAWFAGSIPALSGVHRAVLAQALLAFPDGRLKSVWRRVVVFAMYGVTLTSRSAALSAVGFALIAVAAWVPDTRQGAPGRPKRAGDVWYPALSAALMATLLGVETLVVVSDASTNPTVMTAVYEVALAIIALSYPMAARSVHPEQGDLDELVVQVGPTDGLTTFAAALAGLAEDPSLQVLEWDPTQATFVDESGLAPLDEDGGWHLLPIEEDGQPLAAVRHRSGSLAQPGMAPAVAGAVRLAVKHARLRRLEQAQLAELSASRERLLASSDAQRARIAIRLREHVEEPVTDLTAFLADMGADLPACETAAEELTTVAAELAALTRGLRPPDLDSGGLAFAIAELAARSTLPVTVDERLRPGLSAEVETAAYFVCAEAVANATKHSRASTVGITLESSPDAIHVSIKDDGEGGADPASGTGLLGLVDRVETLGGSLAIETQLGVGTTITARLPLSADAPPEG